MSFVRWTLVALIAVASANPGWGQAQQRRMSEEQFAEKSPKVGEVLPNVKAFDEQGRPVELKDLRGKYTVLVFGCIT